MIGHHVAGHADAARAGAVAQVGVGRLAAEVGGDVVPTVGRVGGGSLPLAEIASYAVALPAPDGEDAMAATLRALDPSVVARVSDGQVLLDVLTVSPGELAELSLMIGRR
jgi:L-seryl-tRNA(Ser) seleniumtransferase